ncbi:MAG: insulinase family protein [Hyphomicrobiales bacterium]|nr:insulinase family protein [Hyphomicrobiales bacterium]
MRATPALSIWVVRRVTLALLALALAASPGMATTIERVVSPGGIVAWLVHEPAVPMIAVDFSFAGGSAQDPAGKAGTASLVAGLLDEGAGDFDSKAFHARLERKAIELGFQADRDALRGALRTLTENREEAFDDLRLALTAPRFDPTDVEIIRSQIISNLRRATTSPSEMASVRWWQTAFAGHPYAHPVNGTLESLPAVSIDDLRAYTRRVLARDNLKVAVVGDIDAEAVKTMLDRVFGGLPARSELAAVADVSPRGLGRRIVTRLDVPQTVIMFGGPGIARQDPDFMAAYVVNHILGGGSFSSRLYQEVREKRGLAYSVHDSLAWLTHAPLFVGGTATRAERTSETLDIVRREISRLADDGPTADELAKAKSFLIGSFPLNLDTSGKIAAMLVQLQIDNLGIDYFTQRPKMIDAVTLDDARRVAKRLLGGGLLVSVVGRPDGLMSTSAE